MLKKVIIFCLMICAFVNAEDKFITLTSNQKLIDSKIKEDYSFKNYDNKKIKIEYKNCIFEADAKLTNKTFNSAKLQISLNSAICETKYLRAKESLKAAGDVYSEKQYEFKYVPLKAFKREDGSIEYKLPKNTKVIVDLTTTYLKTTYLTVTPYFEFYVYNPQENKIIQKSTTSRDIVFKHMHKKEFLSQDCKPKKKMNFNFLAFNNSYILQCEENKILKDKLACIIKIYNIEGIDKNVKNIGLKNCVEVKAPKQIIYQDKFDIYLSPEKKKNTINLKNGYKLEYYYYYVYNK